MAAKRTRRDMRGFKPPGLMSAPGTAANSGATPAKSTATSTAVSTGDLVRKDDAAFEVEVWEVLYTKDVRKKKKLYHDAIMVVDKAEVKLMESNGKIMQRINKGSKKVFDDLKVGQVLDMYNRQVELSRKRTKDEYESGQLFLAGILDDQKENKPIVSNKDLKRKFKAVSESSGASNNVAATEAFLEIDKSSLVVWRHGSMVTTLDGFLAKVLRTHQVEGVKFLFNCVTGNGEDHATLDHPDDPRNNNQLRGCLLADSMGLGKTLQVLCLVWILLCRGPFPNRLQTTWGRKAIIVTPKTLVKNWA